MPQLLKGFIAVTFMLLTIDYGYGDPRVCYNCVTGEDDKKPCNDPVDTDAISIIDCLRVRPTSGFRSGIVSFFDSATPNGTKFIPVCIKASYVLNGNVTTYRTCAPKDFNGTDVCSTFKPLILNEVSANATDIKCSTCNSNFCNSSTSLYASVLILTVISFIRSII